MKEESAKPMQTNIQEQLIKMEPDATTLINQTEKPIKLLTIIICIIFVITGQSIARLLETYQDHNSDWIFDENVSTQPLLHVIGFPLLLIPFLLLSAKKHKQLHITSDRSSLAVLYLCTGLIMVVQVKLYVKGKLKLPYTKFLLIDGTQLYFTSIFSRFIKNIKYNQWIVISLIFTISIASLSSNLDGEWSALLASITFSVLLCNIQSIVISHSNKKASFAYVLELLIFSSLFAILAAVFIFGEHYNLKREMDGFWKGKIVYIMSMVGQAVSWQVYWVGIVGLIVFTDSVPTSNLISISVWPITTVLKILVCNYEKDEFDGFLGAALALSACAVVSCFYNSIRGFGNCKTPRVLRFVLFVAIYVYISEFLHISPNGFRIVLKVFY